MYAEPGKSADTEHPRPVVSTFLSRGLASLGNAHRLAVPKPSVPVVSAYDTSFQPNTTASPSIVPSNASDPHVSEQEQIIQPQVISYQLRTGTAIGALTQCIRFRLPEPLHF
ncbi:hypothetical protein GYMLUDRAFT_77476 [Collybiopsis luxurians FD-317 M1]|uniref:Unplaced genomic scaffold GYMLUscaffold_82, whole genome shotgun sequence n=1 Tax=Collybiopsis luxurians FD-317 M1 TaxID=944289 RepID=A0A0D0BFC1_9AGAR|nr:hypothetical protein GYMLUDRAFT_77476 [Collybiopsis luxurians FD-317 M1]